MSNFSKSKKLILLVTIIASGMSFLMSSAVNIALPSIKTYFGVDFSVIQWILNSYILALGSLMLLSGSLADRFGTKKVFNLGIVIFAFASGICGLATNAPFLIVFRIIQGIGAALMIPGSLSVINRIFEKRGKAIGLWAGISGAVAAAGPFLGGWINDVLSWRFIFFLFFPLALFTYVLSRRYLPEFKTQKKPLDILGTLLVFFSFASLSYGLIKAPDVGWSSPLIVSTLLISGILFVSFIIFEFNKTHPLFPIDILKNREILGANIITLLIYFDLNTIFVFTNFRLQNYNGFSPTNAGLIMLTLPLIIASFSGPSGNFTDKHGPKLQMIISPLVIGMGIFLVGYSSLGLTLIGFVLIGGGMAFIIPAITISALNVKEMKSGAASGLNNTVSRIASLFAVALAGSLLVTFFAFAIQDSSAENKQDILDQRSELLDIDVGQREIIREAYIDAYKTVLWIPISLTLLSSLLSWFVYRKRSIL